MKIPQIPALNGMSPLGLKKTDERLHDEQQARFADQVPSLLSLRRKVQAERPYGSDDFVHAVATLCQCAYEDHYEWAMSPKPFVEPPNPAELKTSMVGLAIAYLQDSAR